MGDDRLERLQELFAAALERAPDQWVAFLSAATDDPHLRAEVLALLKAHEGEGPLDRIAASAAHLVADLGDRLRNALGTRYRVGQEIGRGGMAVVYGAEDLKHKRRVAIKVLKPEVGAAIGAQRFLREIEIAARLAHPNILPLHDSGEAGGLLYFTMPFVEGETLRARLVREKQLPLDQAVAITCEVADALGYAHSLGLIHRDIKPENILFQAGHAVVSDFGIARAVSQASNVTGRGGPGGPVTESGIAVGTLVYMSPEQSAAQKDLDHRTDLYSLGCVLYEMLSGEIPLSRGDIREARPSVSVPLASVIAKACARLPADRFATALEFQQALRGAAAPGKRIKATSLVWAAAVVVAVAVGSWYGLWGRDRPASLPRVAVAPFADRTAPPEPRLAQLGDLTADWITRAISRSKSFDVTAAAVARQAWLADGLQELIDRTSATVIVSGAYSLDRNVVRFDAEIIDARTGRLITDLDSVVIAADSVMQGVRTLVDRVSVALVARMGPQLTGAVYSNPPTLEAFRQYQAGLDLFSRGEYDQSIRHFQQAITFDSTYPPPLLWAAMAHNNLERPAQSDTLLTRIRPLVERLTPIERVTFEWASAGLRGDRAEWLRWGEEGFRLDPSEWAYPYGLSLLRSNRPRHALEVLRVYNRSTPFGRNWDPYWHQTGNAHHLLGDYDRELRTAREWRGERPPQLRDLGLEIRALAALGRVDDVRRALALSRSLPTQGQGRGRRSPAIVALLAAEELRHHGWREAANAVLDSMIAGVRSGAMAADPLTLGRALYVRERWSEALAVFDSLHRSQPRNINYLGYVAVTSARLGDHERVASADRQLASDHPYVRGEHTRWRARMAAVLGNRVLAVQLLKQAADEGILIGIEMHGEMDFESLRGYPPFEAFIAPNGS
jgi:serine/threonine-protein kinase